MHRDFWGRGEEKENGNVSSKWENELFSFFSSMDSDTALILSVIMLLKKEGKHDMLLPVLLYILM